MLSFDPQAVVDVVREAAALAMRLRGQTHVEVKPDNTLVTNADRQLEEFLHERLKKLTPDYAFLGEETGLSGDPDAPCWVIDPIDGTTNFVFDIPLWCISVGVVHRGEAVFGVVAVPPQDEIYWGAFGQGAWREKDGESLRLSVRDSDDLMQEELIACNTTVEDVVDFKGVPCRLRNFGTLAYHLVVLARGSLCASLANQHKLYDIAAGVCLCREAGCEIAHLDGRPWSADVTASRESMPIILAPPQRLARLLRDLIMR